MQMTTIIWRWWWGWDGEDECCHVDDAEYGYDEDPCCDEDDDFEITRKYFLALVLL